MATRGFIGVDSSTTGCKAIVWSQDGEALGEGRAEIALENPEPDGWEQRGERIVEATFEAIARAVVAAGPVPIEALCVTHQRETVLLCDRDGAPLANALVWMDGRCRDDVLEAKRRLGEGHVAGLTGKVPCTTPSVYKARWLLRRRPDVAAARPVVADVHAFLMRHLVGRFVTSLASADPTGLVDMTRDRWSDELASFAGIEPDQLPELVHPGAHVGGLTAQAASRLGLREGLPVLAGAGDGQCAGLGAGITSGGAAYLNLGTALVSGMLSPRYVVGRAFRTLYAASSGYFFETDLKGGMFSVGWLLREVMGVAAGDEASTIERLTREAEGVVAAEGGLFFVPYLHGVMNPYWDDSARGALVGLSGGHGAAHLFRAVIEGLVLEQRLHLEQMQAEAGQAVTEIVLMGGGARSALMAGLVADAVGARVVHAHSSEATSLGAAVLAAAPYHADVHTAAHKMTRRGAAVPARRPGSLDEAFARYRAIYPALAGVNAPRP